DTCGMRSVTERKCGTFVLCYDLQAPCNTAVVTQRAVMVEAVRTPIGRRNGSFAGLKAVELLRVALVEVLRRAFVDPGAVDQVIGGCVTQIGEQGLNVTRNAWLNTGFDPRVACTTVDVSCGSGQQANHLVAALIT